MGHSNWHVWSIWLLKANLITWIINVLLISILILSGSNLVDLLYSGYFSKITLFETGAAFLLGGALAFSGSVLPSKAKEYVLKSGEQWSIDKLKSSEKRANKFIILAAIFLIESLLISFFGF
jgi:hypothetical protein